MRLPSRWPPLPRLSWLAGLPFALFAAAPAHADEPPPESRAFLSDALPVTAFLPQGYATDGSVSYQPQLQEAIEEAARLRRTLVFPPMDYKLGDEGGLRLHSNMTLWMYGAVFLFDEHRTKDGQAFMGSDVTGLRLFGGEIAGRNEAWPAGINIRGIHITGESARIRIRDMYIHGLSSNGIGVFGTSLDQPARDVWIVDTVIKNCCNVYEDYLMPNPGPEKGSVREDQGLVALYYVRDFVVRGCRLERSRSDGTHFYKCSQGQFAHNKVYTATMGGYFVETCDDILAADNVIRGNGSRGATIERGSRNCTLRGNTIQNSGRDGLWAPDCAGLVIAGNVFVRNGRKPNGKDPSQIWNANITINDAKHDPTDSPTTDYLIANNIIETGADQVAAIRVDTTATTDGIVIQGNLFRGDNRRILLEGPERDRVIGQQNHGAASARADS